MRREEGGERREERGGRRPGMVNGKGRGTEEKHGGKQNYRQRETQGRT